jgi:glycosyltransferase involved in cell wall biosynthesis
VATLHDYTLVCPSGGQRIHRRDAHVCHEIDFVRCARCFRESPALAQTTFARLASATGAPRRTRAVAAALLRRVPYAAGLLAGAARRLPGMAVTPQSIENRMSAARRVFDDVSLFVAPSPSIAAEYARLGLPASKVRVSDYGFVPIQPAPRPKYAGPLRIGYVGTLVWHKGVHVLVEAVRMLPPASFELKIFGSVDVFPDYVDALRRQAAGLPVRLMGSFSRDAVQSIYGELDVLVVPSLWLENSPLVIHEAFMAGVAVVGARIGGIADLVEHERSGLLYDPVSPSELASALRRFIDQPGLGARLAAGVPPVKTIEADARQWEDAYAHVLS